MGLSFRRGWGKVREDGRWEVERMVAGRDLPEMVVR